MGYSGLAVQQLQQQISELQSQLTALNLQSTQLEEQRDNLAAEVNCFWEHCTCSARGRAAAVRK
jgi:cell division protein FtsB